MVGILPSFLNRHKSEILRPVLGANKLTIRNTNTIFAFTFSTGINRLL